MATFDPAEAWPYHCPPKDPEALSDAALLFGCFVQQLPIDRIQSPRPETSNPNGHKLMKNYGSKFVAFVESRRGEKEAGPPNCTLVQYGEALTRFFRTKLSNDDIEYIGRDLG